MEATIFCLIGAHRSGKTTTAKAVAERIGIHYHDAGVTRIMQEIGFNPVADLSIEDRLKAQKHLLMRYVEEIKAIKGAFITDRSPLDFIGYTLGEVTMHNTDLEVGNAIIDYIDACVRVANTHFDSMMVLRPLPFFTVDPTKPPPNLAYQEQHQLIVEGATQRFDGPRYFLETTDLQERVDLVMEIIAQRMESYRDANKQRSLH